MLTYVASAGDPADTAVFFPSTTFILSINQSQPFPFNFPQVSVTISGDTLNDGTVGFASSNLQASFSPATVTDGSPGDTMYSLVPSVQLIPESHSNGGQVTIQGQVETTHVPEPGTVSLMALSLGLVGIAVFRRKRPVAVKAAI
jgi:hypothetical protein